MKHYTDETIPDLDLSTTIPKEQLTLERIREELTPWENDGLDDLLAYHGEAHILNWWAGLEHQLNHIRQTFGAVPLHLTI